MTRIRAAAAAILDDWNDIEKVLYAGLALLSIGMALIWFPLALVTPGAILCYAALRVEPDREELEEGNE